MTDSSTTELTLANGAQLCVNGSPREIETIVISAARGSIMELAWLTDANTGQPIAVNPEHVMTLRACADPTTPYDRHSTQHGHATG